MKTTIKLLAVLALMMASLSQHTSASAGGGQAFNFKGPSALASFSNTSGCIVTNVFVIASDSRVRPAPGPATTSSFASVTISQYDACTNTILIFAYGSAFPLTAAAFDISKKLDSAALDVTVNLFDEVSTTTFDVDVSLSWTGTGPLSREHTNTHLHMPGCIINSRSNATFRTAEASGTVSNGATNFTPGASVDAMLAQVKNGTVTIGCN